MTILCAVEVGKMPQELEGSGLWVCFKVVVGVPGCLFTSSPHPLVRTHMRTPHTCAYTTHMHVHMHAHITYMHTHATHVCMHIPHMHAHTTCVCHIPHMHAHTTCMFSHATHARMHIPHTCTHHMHVCTCTHMHIRAHPRKHVCIRARAHTHTPHLNCDLARVEKRTLGEVHESHPHRGQLSCSLMEERKF